MIIQMMLLMIFFKPFFWRYQNNLGTSMTGSDYIFDLVQLSYYKYDRINFM